jgi:hypothetical protein
VISDGWQEMSLYRGKELCMSARSQPLNDQKGKHDNVTKKSRNVMRQVFRTSNILGMFPIKKPAAEPRNQTESSHFRPDSIDSSLGSFHLKGKGIKRVSSKFLGQMEKFW